MEEILAWTDGQPFLNQKLCHLVVQELERTNPTSHIPSQQLIESIVMSRLIENWEANDEPEHLRTIRDRILRNEQRGCRLLDLYQQILQQGEIAVDGSNEQRELRLSGLVVEREQLGFADQVLDGDRKLRCTLLADDLSDKDKDVSYSLAVKVALQYLKAEGLTLRRRTRASATGQSYLRAIPEL